MTPEGATVQEQPMSEAARLSGVYFSPGSAFADIAARPRFWVPLIIGILFAVGYVAAIGQHIGWAHIAQQQIESTAQYQNAPAEQKQQQLNIGVKIGSATPYFIPIFIPIFGLVSAAVLMFIINGLFSGTVRFKQMFAIWCYAGLTGVVVVIISLIVLFTKSPEDFNVQHPLAFSLGAFLNPETTSKGLQAFAYSMDIFTFWTLALIALGITKASPKVSYGKALVGVVLPWLIWVGISAGLASLRG